MEIRRTNVAKSLQALLANTSLSAFTVLLLLKLDHRFFKSWWIVFSPLWLFHATVARCRFSLPAPLMPHDRHWAPCHAIVATPLIVAFEVLLCIYLESTNVYGFAAVNLKVVFLPLLIFEIIVLIDNFRMCKGLLPGEEESTNDEAIWEMLPHFWIGISMIFFVAATTFTLLKLCAGDVSSLDWWDLFLNFGIAECFAFLVCTKWSNPVIQGIDQGSESSFYSMSMRSSDWNSSSLFLSEMETNQGGFCILQDIGGHFMKIPLIAFQVLLCMHLQGSPSTARHIPLPALFAPLLLLHIVAVLFAVSRLVESTVQLIRSGVGTGRSFTISTRVYDCFEFLHHGSRLFGWWSIDEESHEEQALLYSSNVGYTTFCGCAPEMVKKMAKKDLVKEVRKLREALDEQSEITKSAQKEYEKLENEKFMCKVCFLAEIKVVLLPCRHHILCSSCSEKCNKCPICREIIEERMTICDV